MAENIPDSHIKLMRSCSRKDVKAWALTDSGRKIVIRNWSE